MKMPGTTLDTRHSLAKGYINFIQLLEALAFANPEHLGAAYRAGALGGWFAVLHSYRLGILDFSLGAAFNTVSLHLLTLPFLVTKHKSFMPEMSSAGGKFYACFIGSHSFLLT